MHKTFTTNKALDFTKNQWNQLIDSNGILIMWFIEWNNRLKPDPIANIKEFFTLKYNQSAGGDPYPMDGKVGLDGKYVSEGDEDLEPYFLINTQDGVGYIYPYAFVALPNKKGGHTIMRMDW